LDIILEVLLERVIHLLIMPLAYIFTKPWGWLILSVLLAIGGFIYGSTSHQVSYQYIDHASLIPHFVQDGSDYFQVKNSSIYYIFDENDFLPAFKRDSFFSSSGFTFIARKDSENVDVKFSDGTRLTGSGYRVEEITFFSRDGRVQQTFSTDAYSQHPQGFYDDRWIVGRVVISISIILFVAVLAFTVIVSRKQ
jgi:hypothetical protein